MWYIIFETYFKESEMEILVDVAPVGECRQVEATAITFQATYDDDQPVFAALAGLERLDINGREFIPRHVVTDDPQQHSVLFFISPAITNLDDD